MNFTQGLTEAENDSRLEMIHYICDNPETPLKVKPEYQTLINKNVVVAENGELISIYPISLKATNKKVYTNQNTSPVFAMCAIDAIGVHYTIHSNITIESEDELMHTPIHLEMKDGHIINRNEHDIFVLYKDVLKKENCNVDCCPYIHFFTSEQNALEYLKQVQYTGPYQILNLDEANETAKALFRYQPMECGRCCQS
ncbi:TPA: alkylmercury lyase [Staphylococcus pseudintermedius]|nr:alkylmercury lyase [Staphylococcus pseudintermedius]EJD8532262.1 alkylmercury lyase [Staphylococcus pseudintermedius]MDK4083398.1 organomercurial lyase [Staphylococcus pseudintermedius]MDK4146230.1 organomercurial lyase [Staphylococcus pseudintermedius]HDT9061845.1 alkylmercury lyase [Staphylococcus pseudintermedius]